MLWLRSLDDVDARQLAGTEDAQDPFWSPDSRWIGFLADGTLKKVPAVGGAVQVIVQTRSDFRGATWGTRDTILVASGVEGIVSVNAAGGVMTPVTVVDTSLHEDTHRNPSFLPDGHHFLYSVIGSSDQSGVYLGSLDGKTKKLLLHVLTSAVYAHPGYLLFVGGDTLLGQAFDADRLEPKGQPFFVAEHVGRSTSFMSGVSASLTGTIAYARAIAQNGRLAWIDRRGNPLGSLGAPEGDYTDFRLSPDETHLAASLVDPKTNVVDIWITDLARGSTSRVVSDGGAVTAAAVWSPDGTRLAFRSNRTGVIELYERSAAGGGVDRPVLSRDANRAEQPSLSLSPTDWSPDGRQLICSAPTVGSRNDLWLLSLGNEPKPVKFIASPAEEMHGNFSPDGRLVAYTSNQSGRFEIYVETVPRSDRKWSVSTNGGYEPRWRADGREIYYLSEDRKLMAVPVGAGPSFGIPQRLFQTRVPAGVTANRTHYAPSRDGERFLVNTATGAAVSPITVVSNWTATLKK
jgi:Tol biopolymer transport system component